MFGHDEATRDDGTERCVAQRLADVVHGDKCVEYVAAHAQRHATARDIETYCASLKTRLTVGDLRDLCVAEAAVEHAFWRRFKD